MLLALPPALHELLADARWQEPFNLTAYLPVLRALPARRSLQVARGPGPS